ncbi:two-component system regulatory protein YycI [Ligilactobacillus pobuzihii]|uniref:YycH family protein n=1 Tax=Ligilactobacillus pobuzihii TaxID=449659 RepID=A0A0R2LJ11_9LACO|nr:two-component system regulatory protein YycI [Ligilactobacillus pobuzihii]KRK09726.1 YycH family protein [Ligilactobacillus pobuzihii E100301 = KCTC 13174]KRO01689.1 YycH family protein [Ligilactobacillus pobuzihii]GEN48699.1 hypothetical protein LPO01_14910 [Ligilactobacillus pobuzihii]
MNFRRIEWIFLIAFIALDIFLIGAYYNQNGVETEKDTGDIRTTTSVLRSLKDDQISYPKKLSTKEEAGYYIANPNDDYLSTKIDQLGENKAEYSKHDKKLSVTFDKKIKLSNSDQPEKTLDEVIKNSSLVVEGNKYQYEPNFSSKNEVVYTQVVYGERLSSEEGMLKFNISNGYVIGYSQTYLQDIEILREKKKTISQKRALIWLYQYNKLPANSKVKWGKLGYTKLLSVNGSTVYIPAWNFAVKTEGSTIYRRINAFNGAVME